MSDEERTGKRDLTYSRWHRRRSLAQYIDMDRANEVHQIDIDWCEYYFACKLPIALIETQQSKAPPKPARVTSELARMAGIDAYSVSYRTNEAGEITGFARSQLVPIVTKAVEETPTEYARWLWMLRVAHQQECEVQAPWRALERRIARRRSAAA